MKRIHILCDLFTQNKDKTMRIIHCFIVPFMGRNRFFNNILI